MRIACLLGRDHSFGFSLDKHPLGYLYHIAIMEQKMETTWIIGLDTVYIVII